MSKRTFIVNILNELSSDNIKSSIGSLTILLKELEDKNDPEPIEMEIVDTSYQLIEKLNLLENILRKYSNEQNILTGNKLQSLYDRKETY